MGAGVLLLVNVLLTLLECMVQSHSSQISHGRVLAIRLGNDVKSSFRADMLESTSSS